jgi:hypothetical protein
MSISTIDKELEHYVGLLDEPQKKSLLDMIKTFLDPTSEHLGGMTIEEYNQELMEAEAEYQRGEYISHEQMKKEIEEWKKENTK